MARSINLRRAARQTGDDLEKLGHEARRAARAGWRDVAGAFDEATTRTHDLADTARTRVVSAGREGRRRTAAARDALAGRPPREARGRPWIVAVAAGVGVGIGVGIGALLTVVGREYARLRERMRLESLAASLHEELRPGVGPVPSATPLASPGAATPIEAAPIDAKIMRPVRNGRVPETGSTTGGATPAADTATSETD